MPAVACRLVYLSGHIQGPAEVPDDLVTQL